MNPRSLCILFVSIFALSQSGNIIRLCEAHAFTIAFYRLILAFIFMLPFAAPVIFRNLKKIDATTCWRILLMGIIFAFHLITWIMAVQHTKVANAAICYSVTPLIISVGAYLFLKESLHRNIFLSIGLGIAGVVLVGYDDCGGTSLESLWGDALAVISGILFSFYFLIGKTLRSTRDNLFIMNMVYLFAALVCLSIVLSRGTPLSGFELKTQVGLVSLAIVPTIIGHSLFIYVCKYLKASVTSTFTLAEPVLAGIVAYLAFAEAMTGLTLFGYMFIIGGILVIVYTKDTDAPPSVPARKGENRETDLDSPDRETRSA